MAIYDFDNNSLIRVDPTTFHIEGILEKQNLQAALKQQIEIISPESMVIAEEFSEWSDSQRRIDLLAIDKNANLIVIELKRNETGEHMELQAIRYAAMVSTLTFKTAVDIFQKYLDRNNIDDNAEEKLLDFLEWDTPQEEDFALDVKIVLVSANFSKELTTSVMWLLERDIDITCVRLIPYTYKGKVLIDIQHIIPLPEAKSYQVKIKEQAEQRREARKTSKDFTQYLFNGQSYNKRRLVLAIIQNWIKENNPKDINDFFNVFPEQAAHGKLIVEENIAIENFKTTGTARYFIKNEEIIIFSGNKRYAVLNQWGKGSIKQFIGYAKEAGYDIEEVTSNNRIRKGEDTGEILEERNIKLKDGKKVFDKLRTE